MLDVAENRITFLAPGTFQKLTSLKRLDLSYNRITSFGKNTFSNLTALETLDIRGNLIRRYEKDVFKGLSSLMHFQTDDFHLCCLYFHSYPESKATCTGHGDDLSSCGDLLRMDFFRALVWMLALLAIVGNVMAVVHMTVQEEVDQRCAGFKVLAVNLCVSNFLMGVYLTMIGSADAMYRGQYVLQIEKWKYSSACKAAGFLALLSSQVSILTILLITLDRLLVVYRPLHLDLRSKYIAGLACGVVWVVGFVLCSIPFMRSAAHWQFYCWEGVCLFLPLSPKFPGWPFSFGVFVVLDFCLFLLIATGPVLLFAASRQACEVQVEQRSHDMVVSHRLLLLAFSNFCCWVPIGIAGLTAAFDVKIPVTFHVFASIFVLPLSSAVNPFLYTVNNLMEKRREKSEKVKIQLIMGRLHSEMMSWSIEKLRDVIKYGQLFLKAYTFDRRDVEYTEAAFATILQECIDHAELVKQWRGFQDIEDGKEDSEEANIEQVLIVLRSLHQLVSEQLFRSSDTLTELVQPVREDTYDTFVMETVGPTFSP
nr:hypothetical protein BaRGS_004657 [Batillaria attramentaria]